MQFRVRRIEKPQIEREPAKRTAPLQSLPPVRVPQPLRLNPPLPPVIQRPQRPDIPIQILQPLAKASSSGQIKRGRSFSQRRKTGYNFAKWVGEMTEDNMLKGNPNSVGTRIGLGMDWLFKLNWSNGIFVPAPPEGTTYRYFLNKYNNSHLIKKMFDRRPWWKETPNPTDSCVNLIWTQFPVIEAYRKIEIAGRRFSREIRDIREEVRNHKLYKNFEKLHSRYFKPDEIAVMFYHQFILKAPTWECQDLSELGKQGNGYLQASGLIAINPETLVIMNKLENNFQYGHKSAMLLNLRHYCDIAGVDLNSIVPESYYIDSQSSPGLQRFERNASQGIWLIKPAENTFGGAGIQIENSPALALAKVKSLFKETHAYPPKYILQKYIEKPLLFQGRKFDIRALCLITSIQGNFKLYWYPEGYIRTSSSQYSVDNLGDLGAHLTNDCYQKKTAEYGKFEAANKVLYSRFFKVMEFQHGHKIPQIITDANLNQANTLFECVDQQMKRIAVHLVKAACWKADPKRRKATFELVGLDFMLDQDFSVKLIEANNSPSLSHSENPEMNRLLEKVMESVFELAVDPLFPPPEGSKVITTRPVGSSQFELIFSQIADKLPELGPADSYGY